MGLALLAAGCAYEPPVPVLHAKLSAEARLADPLTGDFAVPPHVQENLAGALGMLFGTPARPRFLLLAEWADDGFDPNHPERDADDGGSGEFSAEALERLHDDNRRRFARELSLVRAGRADEVVLPPDSLDLREAWKELLDGRVAGDFLQPELQAEAEALLVESYPSLRDSAELYRVQCLHCHGVEGGGDGPTARFLDPRPRDFRRGAFKFTALEDRSVPRRADLLRVLDEGLNGTAMPSFRRFSLAERNGLADYVRLLSIRGMVERDLIGGFRNEEPLTPEAIAASYERIWGRWQKAESKFLAFEGEVPPATPESIERGRALYLDDARGGCAKCHGEGGRGDGVAAFKLVPVLDSRGEPVLASDGTPKTKRASAYQDDWGDPSLPRDLTLGIFRGGRRPIDVYRRIHAGINGTPMPALGHAKNPQGEQLLSDAEMWDLVHFVLAMGRRPAERTP